MTCPECKTQLDHVICTTNESLKYYDFNIWGEDIGPDYHFDHKSHVFIPMQYYNEVVKKLFLFQCVVCQANRKDFHGLKKHYKEEHNLVMCNLCLDNKQCFPSEQRVYNQIDYDKHIKEGDHDGSIGHPNCEFCKQRYYDREALFLHLRKDHLTCHLCESNGIQHRFYKDYINLESHFRSKHFLCENGNCLLQRYIVFIDSIDLSSHNIRVHPSEANRNVPIFFKVRRNNNNNDADQDNNATTSQKRHVNSRFEGGVGGRLVNGEWQVELPLSSRDPREIRRELDRTTSEDQVISTYSLSEHSEEYPALMGSSAPVSHVSSSQTNSVKISSSMVSKFNRNILPSQEDFPTLSSTVTPSNPMIRSTSNSMIAFNNSVKIKEKNSTKTGTVKTISVTDADFPTLDMSNETIDSSKVTSNISKKSNKPNKSNLQSMMVDMGITVNKKKSKKLISVVKTLSKNSTNNSSTNVSTLSKSLSDSNLINSNADIIERQISISTSSSKSNEVKQSTASEETVIAKTSTKQEKSYSINSSKDTRYDNITINSDSNSKSTTLSSGIKLTNGGWVSIGGAPKNNISATASAYADEDEFPSLIDSSMSDHDIAVLLDKKINNGINSKKESSVLKSIQSSAVSVCLRSVKSYQSFNKLHVTVPEDITETTNDISETSTDLTPSIPTYLPSALGIDYIPLATLLATGDFLGADQFTRDNLIKISGAEKAGRNFVYWTEVHRIPSVDLATTERLWLQFSNGKFGYSIQKRVWDVENGNFDNFIRRIGWTKIDNGIERKLRWFGQNEFIYDLDKAPTAHLPLTSALRGTQLIKQILTHPVWSQYDWKNYDKLKWEP
eukprot:gene20252-26293_t